MRPAPLPNARDRPVLLALTVCGALLCGVLLSGCKGEPAADEEAPPAADPASPHPAPDAAAPDEPHSAEPGDGEPDPKLVEAGAEAERRRVKQRKEMDEKARGLMASFRSRTYDPLRDVGLKHLRGTAKLESGAVVSTYAITFDGTQEDNLQVDVEPTLEAEGAPKGSTRQVVRFANHSLRGGYQTVAYYFPPVQMLYTTTADRARLVTAQRWKQDVQVGYRFDERDLVVGRGANSPRGQEVAEFEWRFFRGRYLLDLVTFKGTESRIEYDYDEWYGVVLLSKATLIRRGKQVVVTFDYEGIEKGEPETPLVPVIVEPESGGDAERPK